MRLIITSKFDSCFNSISISKNSENVGDCPRNVLTYIDGDGVGKSLKPSYDRSRDSESKESTYLNSKPMKSSSDPPLKFPKNQTMTPPSRNLLSSIQRPKSRQSCGTSCWPSTSPASPTPPSSPSPRPPTWRRCSARRSAALSPMKAAGGRHGGDGRCYARVKAR